MNINPFGWSGPAFLLFYVALIALTTLVLRHALRAAELRAAGTHAPRFDDPYLIAYLRGGSDEALRVATVSLADRGLLHVEGGKLVLRDEQALELARREIEKAVLHAYRRPGVGTAVLKDAGALRACRGYQQELERHHLLPGAATAAARRQLMWVALAVLLAVAGVRAVQALLHGRHNLIFLAVLAVIAVFIVLRLTRRRRTYAGDAALDDLRTLFARLRRRALALKPGGASNELAMLIAVFGLAALPTLGFAFVDQIYPKPPSDSSSSDGGSDSSSSCSSSCGGGGCGGCGS